MLSIATLILITTCCASVDAYHFSLCFLQIILALGNYMNSSKRGAVYGFKLQSLDLVSSKKRLPHIFDWKVICISAFIPMAYMTDSDAKSHASFLRGINMLMRN